MEQKEKKMKKKDGQCIPSKKQFEKKDLVNWEKGGQSVCFECMTANITCPGCNTGGVD